MHTATHDEGRFCNASVHTNEKARKGQLSAVILFKKSNAGAHSSTSSTVSSPPSCSSMVVETQASVIQKWVPANTHLVIPLFTDTTT